MFDSLGRLTDVVQGSDLVSAVHFDFAGLGGPTRRLLRSGVTTKYGYDKLGRLETQSDATPTATLAAWRWELPADGVPRLAGFRRAGQREVASTFEVDRAGRLQREAAGLVGLEGLNVPVSAVRGVANSQVRTATNSGRPTQVRQYTLDARHNWLQLDATDNTLDTVPTTDDLDAYTQFRGEAISHEGNGATSTVGANETYSYNFMAEPVAVLRNGSARRFVHDAFGRVVRESGPKGVEAVIDYGWDGPRRAIARRDTGVTHVTFDGEGIDEHLVMVASTTRANHPPNCSGSSCLFPGGANPPIPTGQPLTATFYYHQERSGSVYLMTDSRGAAAELYDYTAYGETTIRTPQGGGLPSSRLGHGFGFQGQAYDESTGLVNMRARLYNPQMGRFTTLDPVGLLGGTNLYAFVDSAPLMYADPFGLFPNMIRQAVAKHREFWSSTPAIRGLNEASRALTPTRVAIGEVPDFLRGIAEGSADTAEGIRTLITSPGDVLHGLTTAVSNPGTTARVLGGQAADFGNRLMQGDPGAKGRLFFEGGSIAGTGGAGTAAKVAGAIDKVADAARLGSAAHRIGDTAGDVGRAARGGAELGLGLRAAPGREGFRAWAGRMGFKTFDELSPQMPTDVQRIDWAMRGATKDSLQHGRLQSSLAFSPSDPIRRADRRLHKLRILTSTGRVLGQSTVLEGLRPVVRPSPVLRGQS